MAAPNAQKYLFEGSQITYQKFGYGAAVLLAFHGFGQNSQVYLPIEKHLGSRFTVFAIDLFFHGDSHYAAGQLMSKPDWHRLIKSFLQEQRIERFSVIGFSLGGRFALATVEGFADKLDQLILIAPDGITPSNWYQLATGSALGRSVFRYGLRHLALLNGLGHALTRIGLLNRTIMRFVEISLSTVEQRNRVYLSWTQFRPIWPNLNVVSKNLTTNPINVYFFTGAFDRLVPGTYLLPLTKKLNNYQLTILKTGHNRLIELTAERMGK
ncbi:alpha/beta hydrolase [Spirosoma sp.]|uniref:alpha/beta hydrolase n=1 Tax=Spirosoma sp. TaxID=1899569 RepID=UPI003B3A54F5